MLYDSPELIPIKNDDEAGVFIRETGLPGSGSTDLLGVEEARRKVLGQILES